MKKASNVKLSLRKLLTAMMAIGPVAILPSPVLATLPTSSSFTLKNGSATVGAAGLITASDRTVLDWGRSTLGDNTTVTNFIIGTGETYNFSLPNGGSILNRVTAGTNSTNGGIGGPIAAAIINGNLTSTGKVFILANGNITVDGGASINTAGGLVLSTLEEANDFNFTSTVAGSPANLTFNGTSLGNITIGNVSSPATITGPLSAWAGNVDIRRATITGDTVIRSVTANAITNLASGTLVGGTSITGNLSVGTNNGTITSTQSLSVSGATNLSSGNAPIFLNSLPFLSAANITNSGAGYTAVPTVTVSGGGGSGATAVATINSTSGTVTGITITSQGAGYSATPTFTISGGGATTVATATASVTTPGANNFGSVGANTSSNVFLVDSNGIELAASTIGGNLTVTSGGAIATVGAVTANGTVSLTANSTGNITYANGSSAGVFSATASNGAVTMDTVGNITIGNVSAGGGLNSISVTSVGAGYTGAPTVSITGGGGTGATATATYNATNGTVTGVTITNAGTGYTSAPTISLVGGGVSPATAAVATAVLNGTTIASISGGTGGNYTSAPLVTVNNTNTGGGNLTATAILSNGTSGSIVGYTITNAGSGYTAAPTITVSGGGSTSNLTASGALTPTTIASFSITNGGTGYTTSPTVSATGGGGGATGTATVNLTSGAITAIAPAVQSTFTSAPTVTISGGGTLPTTAAGISAANSGNAVSLTSSGNITLEGGTVRGSAATIAAANVVATTGAISTGGLLTVNATAGNATLHNVSADRLALTATGNISQTGSGTIATTAGSASTINTGTTGNVTLTNNNTLTNTTLTLTGNAVSITGTGPITLGNTSVGNNLTVNTTGNTTGNVTFGTGSGTLAQTITVGGTTNITTVNSTISDDSDVTMRLFGALNLTTAGANIVLTSANGASGRGSSSFGTINASAGAGNVNIAENQTIGVGNVTANVLTLNSVSGGIIFQGTSFSVGNVSANANTNGISQTNAIATTASGQSSSFRSSNSFGTVLDNTSNSFAGPVNVTNGGNNVFVAGSNFTLGNATSVTGGNLSISTVGTTSNTLNVVGGGNATRVTLTSAGNIVIGGGTFANLTLSAAGTSATAISQNSSFTSNNTLSVNSAGGVAFTNQSNSFATVVINNTSGATNITTRANLTISGTSAGALTAIAGSQNGTVNPGNWNLTVGNLSASSLSLEARNGNANLSTDGVSGNITQAAGTTLRSENALSALTYGGNIVLANNGNSFGQVSLSTGTTGSTLNGGTITFSEDGTAKIGSVSTGGAASLTSRFGGVIEDAAANVTINVGGGLNVSAVNGSILLGDTTKNAGFTTSGNIVSATLRAQGAAAIQSSDNITLGATSANSLAVRSGNSISQSGAMSIFGLSSFNATNSIDLTNAANNFGPISLTTQTANRNVAITEAGTLNLRQVNYVTGGGNGTFTATSVNGDIIDSGLGGVRPAGTIAAPGSGAVTLSAVNGNIIIDDPTTDFPTTTGVVFNSKNVTLAVLGNANLILGASGTATVASGNLSATSALGNISNNGNLTIGGNAFFQTGAGNIALNQSGNQFGTLRFVGNQVSVSQSNDMKITTGSSAIGQAQFASGGNVSLVNTGLAAVAFGNTVGIAATGSITLDKLMQAAGVLTVNAAGTKDLGKLSVSADLSSRTPVNLGTGTYVAPGQ